MTETASPQSLAYQRVLDYENRADPYPHYAELRRTPVARLDDGTFLVTGYREILDVVHDPRFSSDPKSRDGGGASDDDTGLTSAFVMLDPPDHDRLRRLTMRHFGPPHRPEYIDRLRSDLEAIVDRLIDDFSAPGEIDVVSDFAYPFPVTVICEVLGVPREDEPRFHAWSEAMITPAEALNAEDAAEKQEAAGRATQQMAEYLGALIADKRRSPGEDLLSGLANDDGPEGRMSDRDMLNTAIMLLIGGHETTVNMIANGVLTLLRNPEVISRLEREPDLISAIFEELLRLEPPAQITPTRIALTDVTVADVTIPKGSSVSMVWAAANRDPAHFADPDTFDPDRRANDHLGFGGGIHSCFGAPLARVETQIALSRFFARVQNPQLVSDPPPYRRNPMLRGPRELKVRIDGVR